MKDSIVESAAIVAATSLVLVTLLISVAIPQIEDRTEDILIDSAMEQIGYLITRLNRNPLFFDLGITEKWLNLKPEYDAYVEGILHGTEPKRIKRIKAILRVKTNTLLMKGTYK